MSVITLLTAEEFLNLPETPGKQELLDGELISLPPAKHYHSEIARAFQKMLETALDGSRVWFCEGYQLKRGWLIPDVSVTCLARRFRWRSSERPGKVGAYLQEGGAEVWVVYPGTRSTIVFRQDQTLRITDTYQCERIGVTVKLEAIVTPA